MFIAIYNSSFRLLIFLLLSLENVRGGDNEVHVVKHYFPSSVVSWVEEGGSSGQVSHVIFPGSNDDNSKCISEGSSTSDSTKDMHIVSINFLFYIFFSCFSAFCRHIFCSAVIFYVVLMFHLY